MFAFSSDRHATANLEYHVQPLSLDAFGEPLHRFDALTASVCNIRPRSRGEVALTSPDPAAAPAIRPNYLADPADQEVALEAVALGPRPERFESARVFVLPNPSGRNANFSYGEMLAAFEMLREQA